MIHAISSHGPQGASTRVRLLDWLDHLGLAHFRHHWAGLPDNRPRRLLRHPVAVVKAEWDIRQADLTNSTVLLSREASPLSRGDIESSMLRQARHGVFDFDDAIFSDVTGPRRWTRPADKCRRAVESADVVIAGNDYLADWASQHGRDVRMIPSCIAPDKYEAKTFWSLGEAPTIVWLGSPSTEQYVAQIAPDLAEVGRQTGARLVLISGRGNNEALAPLAPMLTRIPWSLDSVSSALASADVAIAPLDDSPYAQGKCAYKLLQYAATGLPTVGSPVGANGRALERFDGIAVRTGGEWVEALTALLAEPESRREMRGRTGLSAVRKHYSFGAWARTWTAATGAGSNAAREGG